MSRKPSSRVLKREAAGLGRLKAKGIELTPELIARLPSRHQWREIEMIMDGGTFPAVTWAKLLGVRIKTFRDWTQEPGFPEPHVSEDMLPEHVHEALEAGESLFPGEWEEWCGAHEYGVTLKRGQWVWDAEELALWLYHNTKHYIHHAWAWWLLEYEMGTWMPKDGYLEASPIALSDWKREKM